jgi:hypothetical protein
VQRVGLPWRVYGGADQRANCRTHSCANRCANGSADRSSNRRTDACSGGLCHGQLVRVVELLVALWSRESLPQPNDRAASVWRHGVRVERDVRNWLLRSGPVPGALRSGRLGALEYVHSGVRGWNGDAVSSCDSSY